MSKIKIYLSGAELKVDDKFQTWRDECFYYQMTGYYLNLEFINPIAHFNYTTRKPKTDKQCKDLFMWQIEKSDVLLVNLDKSDCSVGTGYEVEHANCFNIPIIGFGKNPDTLYSWTKENCSVVFDTLEEALDYISGSYGTFYE